MDKNRKNANPINDKVDPQKKPAPVKSQEVRPQSLPEVKRRQGITLMGDYYDDRFGRA